jgi:predicted permease
MLLGMALLVLLIAAANIAGVMLARGFARRREIAVRLAMGAGRGRVVRHLLAESLALLAVGGLLGVGLAWLGTGWLARIDLPPQVPPVLLSLTPDARVLAFATALTGLTGVLFGLAPALRASRPDLIPALKTGSAGPVGGEGGRLRALFVGGQVALAVTLLLTGMLFARSLQMGLRTDLGFEPEGVVAATVSLGSPLDYDEDEGRAFFDELLTRVRALPGVERAGLSRIVLVSGASSSDNVRSPDRPDAPEVNASYALVSPDYFETMGIDVLAGRAITPADARGSRRVAVINRALADRLWPGESPLGHVIEGFGAGPAEVVGITETGRYAFITEQPRPSSSSRSHRYTARPWPSTLVPREPRARPSGRSPTRCARWTKT